MGDGETRKTADVQRPLSSILDLLSLFHLPHSPCPHVSQSLPDATRHYLLTKHEPVFMRLLFERKVRRCGTESLAKSDPDSRLSGVLRSAPASKCEWSDKSRDREHDFHQEKSCMQ